MRHSVLLKLNELHKTGGPNVMARVVIDDIVAIVESTQFGPACCDVQIARGSFSIMLRCAMSMTEVGTAIGRSTGC
jgi:hypothetical protein